MKTKNNVQKAVLRSAAVIVSFVLISFTVSAQTFWKKLVDNTGLSDIAMAMAATSNTEENDVNTTYYLANEVEPALEIESWMTDDSRFNTNAINYKKATEDNLQIENWMTNEFLFQPIAEQNAKLTIEPWMVNSQIWKL